MTLRKRLTLAMLAVIMTGCCALVAISVVLTNQKIQSELHERLTTYAYGAAQIVGDHNGIARVDPDDVSQMNQLRAPDEHISVLDRHGRLLYGEHLPKGTAAEHLDMQRLEILHPKHGHLDDLGVVYVWPSEGWFYSFWRTSALTLGVAALLVVIATIFLARRLADAVLTPVERVANLAERIETNELSQRLGSHGNDELGRLCASFDRMLERLEASFEKERRFVADASHELRAPLAVVRAETDLALRRDRSSDEYRCALESIDRETTRLETLVDQLLGTMRETTLVGDALVDVGVILEGLAMRLQHASQNIHVSSTGGLLLVRGHGQSIERALTAVLHNALTHGGGGRIAILASTTDREIRIDVVDDGEGFCEEALAHATERFWRGDTARSRGGTGLGLAIARVLVEVHGGEIRLTNTRHAGAAVSLLFPRAVVDMATSAS